MKVRVLKLNYKIITTETEFKKLEKEWNKLYENSDVHFFSSFYWNFYWWKYYGTGSLFIISIFNNNKLLGIAPFYIRRKKSFQIIPYNIIKFISSDIVASDYLDIIINSSYRDIVTHYFIKIIENIISKNTFMFIKDFSKSSNIYDCIKYLNNKYFIRISDSPKDYCPYIILPNTVNDVFSFHSKKTIKRFLSYLNSAFKNNNLSFRSGFINNDPHYSFNKFLHLHLKRMKSIHKYSHFEEEIFCSFHKIIIQNCKDSVTFFWLFNNGIPIAVQYCFLHKNNIYFYNSGFDPNSKITKPGQILFYKVFQYLIENDISTFYFLRGTEKYKYFWTKKHDELFYAEVHTSIWTRFLNSIELRSKRKIN